jgi:hypothetical protein
MRLNAAPWRRGSMRDAILLGFVLASFPTHSSPPAAAQHAASDMLSSAQTAALDTLVRAYPDFLMSHDGKVLIWKDGTRMPVSDGRSDKSFEEKLRNPSILDQLSMHYPEGKPTAPPGPQNDPGRFRNSAFFDKMYGDCTKGQVQTKLTTVAWLFKSGGG